MLPVICGNCPTCTSEEVRVLSRSHATGEVLTSCRECGDQWWEDDLTHPRNAHYISEDQQWEQRVA